MRDNGGLEHLISTGQMSPGEGNDAVPSSYVAEQSDQDLVDAMYGQSSSSIADDYYDLDLDVGAEKEIIDDVLQGTGAGISLSEYMRDHPGLSADDYFQYMSNHSDEWAEKYLDYKLEKESLAEQNKYTADREDTAYQRLVQDLRAAGLNPALMYGSSASPQVSNSLGYLKQSEGATTRTNNTFVKLKNLLLGVMAYELYRKIDITNAIFSNGKKFTSILGDLSALFA